MIVADEVLLGACPSIQRGRERDGFAFSRGGADEVGFDPNEEATTTNEGKSVRSRRVGSGRGVCGVARLARGAHHGQPAPLPSAPFPTHPASPRTLSHAPTRPPNPH